MAKHTAADTKYARCRPVSAIVLIGLACHNVHWAAGRAGPLPSIDVPLSDIFFVNLSPSSLKSEVLPIARELVERGHHITIATPILAPDIKAQQTSNLEMVAIPMDLSLIGPMGKVLRDWSSTHLVGPKAQHWKASKVMADFNAAAGSFYESYVEGCRAILAGRSLPSLFIIHGFDTGIIDLAHSLSVPYIIFHPMPLGYKGYADPLGVPDGVLGIHASTASSLKARLAKVATRAYLACRYHIDNVRLNQKRRRLGLAPLSATASLWQEHMVLSTWTLGLEPSRIQSPLVQHVGFPTLPFQAPAKGLSAVDAELTSWLDQSTNGVIYVAYGSLSDVGKSIPVHQHQALLAAITSFAQQKGARVLVSTRGDALDLQQANEQALRRAQAANGTIRQEPWVNQRMVLAHPAVKIFVSHTGQMSVGDAVMAITPILAVPICCDQGPNAVRCEDAGIGLSLDRHQFTHDEAIEKLGRLWGNESVVAALQYHHKLNMQGKGPIHRAADVIESALTVGTSHLVPYETRVSWLAANHIDIIACISLGIVGSLLLVRAVLPLLVSAASRAIHSAIQAGAKNKSKVS